MKKLIVQTLLLFAFACLATAGEAAQSSEKPLTLFTKGHGTTWRIYLAERPSAPERHAAEELKRMIDLASQAKRGFAEIFYSDKRPEKGGIIIGDLKSPLIADMAEKLKLKKTDDDETANYVIDGNIYLAGNSPRATLYAVYAFIQREMGVRWLWEGEDGEFIPDRYDVKIKPDLAYNYTPPFRYRNITLSKKPETALWLARNFSHVEGFAFGGERYYGAETIQPRRTDYKEHPEYFALIKGERYLPPPGGWSWVINGCWSNEGFTKLCIDRIIEGIRNTGANHISLHPADSLARCECENCAKLNPDPSSRWFQYNAKIIRELKKTYPDLKYSVLAYQEYREVPKDPVEEVLFVEYCQYDRCYIHKFSNEECKLNKKSLAKLNRWITEKGLPIGIYGYEFDVFEKGMALPLWELFEDEIKYFRDKKLIKVMTEAGPAGEHSRLARYVYLQLIWNPDRTADDIVTEWCKTAYGPGALFMKAYFKECAKAWDSMNLHLSNCFNNAASASKLYCGKGLPGIGEKAFADAENNIRKLKDEKLKKQYLDAIAFERKELQAWKELYEKATRENISLTIFKEGGDNSFDKIKPLSMKKRFDWQKEPPKTETRLYWSDDALHIQVICFEEQKEALAPQLERDDAKLFGLNDSIEVFLQDSKSKDYYHMAFARNGSVYDALGHDASWNGDWKFDIREENGKWTASAKIPFKELGAMPKSGDEWKLVVIRTSKPGPGGFPGLFYHDMSGAANITLSDGKAPE